MLFYNNNEKNTNVSIAGIYERYITSIVYLVNNKEKNTDKETQE